MFLARLLFVLALGLTPIIGAAQSQDSNASAVTLDAISQWEQTARRAEEAIAAGRASTAALEELRSQLVIWRNRFSEAQGTNKGSIKTLQAQINALGPKPEGVEEAPEIVRQRSEMDQHMAQLQAPAKTAQVAYSRANGLIRGVDQIIRARQTDALLELGASPLNPAHWPKGISAVHSSFNSILTEFKTAWNSQTQRTEFKNNTPVIVVMLLIALVLLARGRIWMERLTHRVQAKTRTAGRWVLGFILSIAQMLLPLIGLLALAAAIYATEMVGVRGDIAGGALIEAGILFMLARWIGGRIFPKSERITPPLNLTTDQRKKGRFFSAVLGILLGVINLFKTLSQFDNWSEVANVVVAFPLIVLVGYVLVRLARLMHAHVSNEQIDDEPRSYRNSVIYYISRVVIMLGFASPVLAAVGFFDAAQAIGFPTAGSLGLLAILMILQRVISEVYALLVGSEERAREALIPVLISFAMLLASTPLFALIWGARLADLTEMWSKFQEGVALGDTKISPTVFLTFALVFAVGYMLTRLIQGTLRTTVLPKTKIDVGGRNAIVSGVGYIGIFLAALIAISGAGIDLSSLAIVAGALSVGIGFGLQNIVSNFVSGIILLIERPISEGDWIEVGNQMGIVRDISVRSTRIETFDRTDVIVPNSDLVSGTVTNWTRGNSIGRVIVPVGVAYGTDTKWVEGILLEIAKAHPMVLANPKPSIIFQGFGADSLDFEIRAILRDVNWVLSVKSDMNHEIARRFGEEGIEIPFAQRDVWLRNPEALRPEAEPAKAPKTPKKGSAK